MTSLGWRSCVLRRVQTGAVEAVVWPSPCVEPFASKPGRPPMRKKRCDRSEGYVSHFGSRAGPRHPKRCRPGSEGVEVSVEQDHRPVAVIKTPQARSGGCGDGEKRDVRAARLSESQAFRSTGISKSAHTWCEDRSRTKKGPTAPQPQALDDSRRRARTSNGRSS